MKTNNQIDEIRKLLKNINDDEEIDKIHDILDRLDGNLTLQNARINGQVAKIVENGIVSHVDIVHQDAFTHQIGGGTVNYPDGPIEANITFTAHPRDVYDD